MENKRKRMEDEQTNKMNNFTIYSEEVQAIMERATAQMAERFHVMVAEHQRESKLALEIQQSLCKYKKALAVLRLENASLAEQLAKQKQIIQIMETTLDITALSDTD